MSNSDETMLANRELVAPASTEAGRGVLLEVVDAIKETADAVSMTFVPADPAAKSMTYEPGQFLTLRLPTEAGPISRSYSLSSAPGLDSGLTVTIKRVPAGLGSNWLCDNATSGLTLLALPPSGRFVLGPHDDDVVLLGAGSGITPLMSIAKTVLNRVDGRVFLFYANRDAASVIFAQALRDLQDAHPGRLNVIHWLEELQGMPTVEKVSALLPPQGQVRVFVCGPGPFMAVAKEAARAAGVPRERVLSEIFVSLSGDAFTVPPPPRPVRADDDNSLGGGMGDDAARATVVLNGTTTDFTWPRRETLVDTLLALGLDVPYTCREGDCGSCTGLLKRGEVDPGENDILDPDDIADGYILGCQARPLGDELLIEF